jgi:hypothetical protein
MKTPLFKQRSARDLPEQTMPLLLLQQRKSQTHEYSRQLAEREMRERLARWHLTQRAARCWFWHGLLELVQSMTSCRIHLFLYFSSRWRACTVARYIRTHHKICSQIRPYAYVPMHLVVASSSPAACLLASPKNSCSRKARRLCRETADVRLVSRRWVLICYFQEGIHEQVWVDEHDKLTHYRESHITKHIVVSKIEEIVYI